MATQAIETEVRTRIHDIIVKALSDAGLDVLPVANNEDSCPVVSQSGEELYVNVIVKTPRGQRIDHGYEPYDGYAKHEDYVRDLQQKEEDKRIKQEEAKAKAKTKKRRKAKTEESESVEE